MSKTFDFLGHKSKKKFVMFFSVLSYGITRIQPLIWVLSHFKLDHVQVHAQDLCRSGIALIESPGGQQATFRGSTADYVSSVLTPTVWPRSGGSRTHFHFEVPSLVKSNVTVTVTNSGFNHHILLSLWVKDFSHDKRLIRISPIWNIMNI